MSLSEYVIPWYKTRAFHYESDRFEDSVFNGTPFMA
jgi:hypothetical protein